MPTNVETQEALMLPPEAILAEGNSRYGLKSYKVDALAKNIVEQGGVLQNLVAEKLETPVNGHKFRLIAGFYRHAAVTKLNKEQKAGLLLPVVIREPGGDLERLKTQLSENMERENQSPMDKATAIKALMDLGVSRADIRAMFSAPGGRKGGKMQPASNSFLNMTLSFLEFPKPIQKRIHDGEIGVGGAYTLSKAPREKWDAIIAQLDANHEKELKSEEKEELDFIAAEKKEAEKAQAAEALKAEIKAAEEKAKELTEKAEAVMKAEQEKYVANAKAKGEEKKAAAEAFRAAQAETRAAEKVASEAKKELEKATAKAAKLAEAEAKKAEAAAKGKPAPKTATTRDVEKAVTQVGGGVVMLNATEMRKCINWMASTEHHYPKVGAVGRLIQRTFNSDLTEGQMVTEIAKLLGDKKAKGAGAEKV